MTDICRDATGEKFAERPGLVHYWARNNFKTAEDRAIGFAYAFLGVRIQCAQCHKHPFDQWSKSDFDNFEKLFTAVQANQQSLAPDAKKIFASMVADLGVDETLKGNQLRRELGERLKQGDVIPFPELVVNQRNAANRNQNKKNAKSPPQATQAKLLGSDWVAMDEEDARQQLMDWLRDPSNPYFAKAITNRIWAQYFGVGIVNPPDDLNLANAPSNAPLLDYLSQGFIDNGFDLHWLHREILNSDAYQRSWIPNETNRLDRHNFSHSLLRRLPAESAYDAVRVALVNDELAAQARDLAVPRALTLEGASAKTNNRDDQSYALTVFGRSVRESNCDCDRSSEPSLLQTVFLLNDAAVQGWLADPKTSWVSQVAKKFAWQQPPQQAAEEEARDVQLNRILSGLQQRSERIEQRLLVAKQKKQQVLIENLEKQKQDLLRQARSLAKKNGLGETVEEILNPDGKPPRPAAAGDASVQSTPTAKMTEEQALWIAENAYLRTLSRKPNAGELSSAVAYLKSEQQPSSAVAGIDVESDQYQGVHTQSLIGREKGSHTKSAKHPKGRSGFWCLTPFPFHPQMKL